MTANRVPFEKYDWLRTWNDPDGHGFRLNLYDTGKTCPEDGKTLIAYRFWHKLRLIFQGADIWVPPTQTIDGDETVRTVLTFLSLRPGDTDREFFDYYTAAQLRWVDEHAQTLSLYTIPEEEDSDA